MIERSYFIVDDTRWLERLLPVGIKLVQMRIKDKSPDQVVSQIKRAKALCSKSGAQLVVNDHWELAIELGCDFIHLGQEDLHTADLKAIREHNIRLGISTHSQDELENALAYEPDYIALGPVYETTLKAMKFAPQGLATVTAWKAQLPNIPLVAIGGMTPERAVGALAAGADSVAVITDVLTHKTPEIRVKQWLNI